MSVPGFSADASLYRTTGRYRATAAGISAQAGQVLPQNGVGIGPLTSEFPSATSWVWYYLHYLKCLDNYGRCLESCADLPYPFDEKCRQNCSRWFTACL
jgi:hypothetical protein